ncbi:dihydrodipicolinate synthase family protein [Eggerthellaceae bacterium zg-893]|nr:dihydrodipicolinate synthase family protein [Eggerthellaceae bacterium zg-893]
MDASKFRGVVPPVVIPLDKDRHLDVEALHRTINRMIDAGVDGLFFLGSSGEVAFMTDAQRQHIFQEAAAAVNGRVPLMAGVIDMETMRVVDQVKRAESYGVDAVVATAPFYALGGPKEVERHFRAIREHTDLPLFAYDLPVCVHTKLDPTMLVRLGKDGVLQGVKDSSGDDVAFRWMVLENEDAGHPLQLLTGHEVCVDGAYLAGADGSVPGLANVDPYSYVEQWQAACAGDWERVRVLQDHLARLMFITRRVKATVGFGAGVGAFKTALWQMGVFNTNQMREPVQPLAGEDVDHIVQVLECEGLMYGGKPNGKCRCVIGDSIEQAQQSAAEKRDVVPPSGEASTM